MSALQTGGASISVAYCPERVLPGRILSELVNNDRCIGGITPTCARRAQRFYKMFVRGACNPTTARAAELVKLIGKMPIGTPTLLSRTSYRSSATATTSMSGKSSISPTGTSEGECPASWAGCRWALHRSRSMVHYRRRAGSSTGDEDQQRGQQAQDGDDR